MKKFKLIREYPNSPKIGTIAEKKDEHNCYHLSDIFHQPLNSVYIENYPEFWEEVKDSLFITEDGFEVFLGDFCHEINTSCWQLHPNIIQRDIIMPSWMKVFKNLDKAIEYFEQNKPRFSIKDIEEALESSYKRETYHIVDLGYDSIQIDRFKEDLFKQKLGI